MSWEEFRDYWTERSSEIDISCSGASPSSADGLGSAAWKSACDPEHRNGNAWQSFDCCVRHDYIGSTVLEVSQMPDEYTMQRKLGSGHYASVHLVKVRAAAVGSADSVLARVADGWAL